VNEPKESRNTEPNNEPAGEFEQALTRALRRVEVKAELTQRFLAVAAEAEMKRVAAGGGPRLVQLSTGGRVLVLPKPKMWMGGAIAAVLVLGLFAGERVHQHRERERVNQQFEQAMRVTDHALDKTEEQLERAGLKLGD